MEGAEKVSGVWLYAADNIRTRMLWGKVLHRSYSMRASSTSMSAGQKIRSGPG
jgi:hypothetical protein